MRRRLAVFLVLVLFMFCGTSGAYAKGFKVQLMEEGTEYTQFFGGFPWDIQPFTLPFQQAGDQVICGVWMPKATPIHQDCVLAAIERGDKILLIGGVKTEGGWKKTILSDHFFRENQEFTMVGIKLVSPDDQSVFRFYPAVAYGNEFFLHYNNRFGRIFLRTLSPARSGRRCL